MFSYYGGKEKLVNLYPAPRYPKIIEPFAGSARYSLKWFERQVLLVDKYPVITEIWNYLKQVSSEEILGLPMLKYGDSLNNYPNLSDIQKKFLGFLVVNGVTSPSKNVGSFEGVNVERDLRRIARSLDKIRHWEIRQGDYRDIENQEATWFIDPPYQFGGEHYKISNKNLDYAELAEWCRTRRGQVIVCENTRASWMPFWAIGNLHGSKHNTTEAIWLNDQRQLSF